MQICDLPDTTPLSKLAYWQSFTLSRDLQAQVGSQSQLNARQLVSCPSLMSAALVSDPAVVMVPLQSPPKRSVVTDWLQQQIGHGEPVDSNRTAESRTALNKDIKSRSVASNSSLVDSQPPVDSGRILMPSKNTEPVNSSLISREVQLTGTKSVSDVRQQSVRDNIVVNVDADDQDIKNRKKSLLRRRECRVAFLADAGHDAVNSAELVIDDGGSDFEDRDGPAAGRSYPAGGGGSCDDSLKVEEVKSPTSDSTSVLFGSQQSSGGRSLPKASFIDLEVPSSWQGHRRSQGSRQSGIGNSPPGTISEAVAVKLQVASTPAVGNQSRRDGEDVDLSVISCSPITPRTSSSGLPLRTVSRGRTDSRTGVEHHKDGGDDDDSVTIVPCSPITVGTGPDVDGCCHGNEDADDITVVPCTPVTPTSSQDVKNSSSSKRLESEQGGKPEEEDIMVIPCSPLTPTTISNRAGKNKSQRDIRRISNHRVCLTV